ncbi:CoA pyrophosphatase [Pelistega europaea]|uniref:CoA pyrophosphatase n=1 Tax=Pelistega europaea TaxID=106147 RepID=A0A7Y4L8E1_9BURK|nr:CoA pyrophosphatase [Pelistega europaea]NOL48874.1 CoA pyrophosphatase [Pelistega europaea]
MVNNNIKHGNPSFDPQTQQSQRANNGLLAIPDALITPDFIRAAFVQDSTCLEDPIIAAWNEEKRQLHQQTPYIPAATLMPLVETKQGMQMILTRRASHLKKHSGQISFPGGRVDETDSSIVDTALRETLEEIGLTSKDIDIIGVLPDFFTGTGFLMSPVVGLVKSDYQLTISRDEVDEVFAVPLSFLLNPDNHFLHEVPVGTGTLRQYFSMPWKNYFIWGATAAVIRNFYRLLSLSTATK